jgi:hypothetical protein
MSENYLVTFRAGGVGGRRRKEVMAEAVRVSE